MMTASSAQATGEHGVPRISFSEWLRLRRTPHPDFVSSLQELPTSLLELAERALVPGERFHGALLLPQEYYPRKMLAWEYAPERALIFLDKAALYVCAAGPATPPAAIRLDVQSLLYVRSTLLLLYGLLEFKADCGGQPAEIRLEYNTVIWQSLRGPVGRFVAGASLPPASTREEAVREANAAALRALPYKFANGLRYYALEPRERLLAAVFQPAIWERHVMLPRQVTPNTLLALTDGKLVVIEEKRSAIWRRQPPQGEYGWIFTYIPRDRVVDMIVTPSARWTEVRLGLEWGASKEERTFLLEPTVAARWQNAWEHAPVTAPACNTQ